MVPGGERRNLVEVSCNGLDRVVDEGHVFYQTLERLL